ncbi:hypothetical protein L226DRAFT_572854 [Lentinus tigrinus ALCF2SS1-7]|uniref:F-box domain-containing protein n=1 Tax=Lentinus tigrinus ALCF2SS1-6 TaxID=1328759 RepID=A0A5C2S4M8_9APHY|nr:hypothetical protein L227DRAFT_182838 [Lentinus tigrinus ALCF2SS1-6]RPD72738.1 hypothetical protein L226DRAFT_572854 [Lentinus tigrinus ALCF2SS1-7]
MLQPEPNKTKASVLPGLPGEVTDNIIDHLHDDKASLLATALVSRSWLPSSQHHLFFTTSCQLTVPGRGLTEFVEWLSTAQYASARVEILLVEGHFGEDPLEHPSLPEIYVQDLETAMEHLTSLLVLFIRGATLASRIPSGEVYGPSTRRSLDALFMWVVATTDGTFYPVVHLLSLFSALRLLCVDDLECTWDFGPTTVSSLGLAPPIRHAPSVSNLILSRMSHGGWSGYRGIIHLFRHSQPKWQLEELGLSLEGEPLDSVLNEFLPDCEATLTCITIPAHAYVSRSLPVTDNFRTSSTSSLSAILPSYRANAL